MKRPPRPIEVPRDPDYSERTPPRRPRPVLPNPGVTTNGRVMCNEPLVVNGATVGYCCALVHERGTRFTRPGWHKGPHRIEW
jgi:hypothetical protein